MINTLIALLIVGLVLYVIYFVLSKFLEGTILQIIGIIMGLIFLLYALNAFHLLPAI
jgi:hypothetical protein